MIKIKKNLKRSRLIFFFVLSYGDESVVNGWKLSTKLGDGSYARVVKAEKTIDGTLST